jgi:hypothetical protein
LGEGLTVFDVVEAIDADLGVGVVFGICGDDVVGMILGLRGLQLLLVQVEHFDSNRWGCAVVVAVVMLDGIDIDM